MVERVWRVWLAAALGVSSLAGPLQPSARAHTAHPTPDPVVASAPIGTALSVTVAVEAAGQPGAQALLYEALPAAPIAAASAPLAPLRVHLPNSDHMIEPDLELALQAAPDGRADMVIYLADQADLSAAAALPDWNARGVAVVAALQAQAAATQPALLADLAAAGYAPHPYWIVNAV